MEGLYGIRLVAPPLELVHLVFELLVGCNGAVEGNIWEGVVL